MDNLSHDHQSDATAELEAFMIQQINAGADRASIIAQVEQMGVSRDQATTLVDALYPEIIQTAKEQEFSVRSLFPAALGGLLAALVGGAVWGAIVIYTGFELGIAAWGMGLLAGGAVVLFARGSRGMPLQAIAVAASVVGIAIGKYFSFYHLLNEFVVEEHGAEAATDLLLFSDVVFYSFAENASWLFGGYDILWIGLAVVTAWRIPQGIGVNLRPHLRG